MGETGSESAPTDDSETETFQEATELLEVLVGEELFLLDVADIENVAQAKPTSRVPRSEPGVHGVVDIRGEVTVVLSLRRLLEDETGFEVPESKPPIDSRRIVIFDESLDKQRVGLLVDSVGDVQELPEAAIETDDSLDHLESPGFESGLLAGAVNTERATTEATDETADADGTSADDTSDVESLVESSAAALAAILDAEALLDIARRDRSDADPEADSA